MITTKEIPLTGTRTVTDSRACDLCGKKCKDPHVGNWAPAPAFDFEEVKVELGYGSRYPDCGDKTTKAFDICPECFLTKLVPWLESQGASPREEKTDW